MNLIESLGNREFHEKYKVRFRATKGARVFRLTLEKLEHLEKLKPPV